MRDRATSASSGVKADLHATRCAIVQQAIMQMRKGDSCAVPMGSRIKHWFCFRTA